MPPSFKGDTKETPTTTENPASAKIQALDKPWIVVRTVEAAVVNGKFSRTTRKNDFKFLDGNKIYYTVQAQPAIPSPCYIYALDKAKTPAKVIFFSKKPISAGQTIPISDSQSIDSVEPFMLDDGPAEDNVIIIASPARIPSLEKKYCGLVFDKALECVGANPDGVAASEKDIGVGENTTPSLSLTYFTTYHKPK
jgi:hypothetical protein